MFCDTDVKSRVKLSTAVQSVPPALHKAITSAPTSCKDYNRDLVYMAQFVLHREMIFIF